MDNLQSYSRHVPQILRHQIIIDLVRDYLSDSAPVALTRKPSIQRFKGALLFIDISGFTVLSQKLDIESLKNNINDYFTKMLAIIQRWGGDVIKFAGDALYIVWQVKDGAGTPKSRRFDDTASTDSGDKHGHSLSSRDAIDRAASCATEICATCGNYEVKITATSSDRRTLVNAFQYKTASSTNLEVTEDISYLDVHAGLSYGTMAGIDIGSGYRWEYFLAGRPLSDVAAAENHAKKGDVVMCKYAHDILHGMDIPSVGDDGQLLCGCRIFEENFFFLSKGESVTSKPHMKRKTSQSRVRLSRKEGLKDILSHGTRVHEDFLSEIDMVYEHLQPILETMYESIAVSEDEANGGNYDPSSYKADFELFYDVEGRKRFAHWIIKAMTDELAKHVHDVERKTHVFHESSLKERFRDIVQQALRVDRGMLMTTMISVLETQHSSATNRSFLTSSSPDASARDLLLSKEDMEVMMADTHKHRSSALHALHASTSFAAEIFSHSSEKRSLVTVMFIKIDSIDIVINEDFSSQVPGDNRLEALFGFLPRSQQELDEDQVVLNRLQRCFAVLHDAIYSTEGQMRQFIIDDKGTVCIATFGLMGSVSVDNAASAIACAEKIILGLEGIELDARIGVTTGEAYCGVVGSSIRHEYAVMGPSTNLSARLMGRAEPRSIICDETTYGQDRANKFILLDELTNVKGYAKPVKIFQPRSAVDLLNSNLIHDVSGKSAKTVRSAIITSKFVKGVYGVMKSVKKNPLFSAKIAKAKGKIRKIYESEFHFISEDNKSVVKKGGNSSSFHLKQPSAELQRKLFGRKDTIRQVFESIIPSFGTIQNVIFEIDSLCRMVVIGSSVGYGKSAILSAIALKLESASQADHELNFFIVSDNTFSKLRLKATVPLSYWGFILFDLLKIVATNFQMELDTSLPAHEQSRLRYLHTFDSLVKQLPEKFQEPSNQKLLLRLMKLDSSLRPDQNRNEAHQHSHQFNFSELETLVQIIVHFVDLIPKIMNCAMILVLDDAHFLDSWSLKALHQTWLKVKGVCMILSFNPSQYHATSTAEDDHLQYALNKNSIRQHSLATDKVGIFAEYTDTDRFNFIELPLLDPESTKQIARDILGDTTELSEAELRQLYDISNGNPLYTVELMYAVALSCKKGGKMARKPPGEASSSPSAVVTTGNGTGSSASAGESISPTRTRDFRALFSKSKRVEEVIYYRLDQLNADAQVLLKAASVAVSNGRTFSLELIYFMLNRDELFSNGALSPRRPAGGSFVNADNDVVNVSSSESLLNDDNNNGEPHLIEQIIPYLINHHIFIRVSHTKVHQHQAGVMLEPPKATPIMKEFERQSRMARQSTQKGAVTFDDIERVDAQYDEDEEDESDEWNRGRPSLAKPALSLEIKPPSKMVEYYEFIAPIEQSTIYGLITDDQRKYFHERVASFYRETLLDVDVAQLARGDGSSPSVPPPSSIPSSPYQPASPSVPAVHPTLMMTPPSTQQRKTLHHAGIATVGEALWIEAEAQETPSDQSTNSQQKAKFQISERENPEDLREEGFHWEKANFWSTALRTYMRSAELEKERGNEVAWLQCLQYSLRVYKVIEQESFQNELPLMPNQKLPYPELILKVLLGQHMGDTDVVLYLKSIEQEMMHVWEVFEYDMDLIPLVFSLHLSLAGALTLSWATLGEIATMAGVALKLMFALRYLQVYNIGHSTQRSIRRRSLSSMTQHAQGGGLDTSGHHSNNSNQRHFHLHSHSASNHHMIHSQFLSSHALLAANAAVLQSPGSVYQQSSTGVSFNYRELFNTKNYKPDPHHLISTLHIIYNTVMRFERPEDRDGTYYYYIAFKVGEVADVDVRDADQNACLSACYYLRHRDYEKAVERILPLLSDPTRLLQQSNDRVRRFGVDLLPSIASELAQHFFLTKQQHRFHEVLETPLYQTLMRLPHLPSVEISLLSILSLLVFSEDAALFRKIRMSYRESVTDRRDQMVLVQGKLQEMVNCWTRTFVSLYTPSTEQLDASDIIDWDTMTKGLEYAERLYDNIRPEIDPEDREMNSVEVKAIVRYGAAVESLALQMVCGLMTLLSKDEVIRAQPAGTNPGIAALGLTAIIEQDEGETCGGNTPRPQSNSMSSTVAEITGITQSPGDTTEDTTVMPTIATFTAHFCDDLFSKWWDRMFLDVYTLRYLPLLNILNPLLLIARVLTTQQQHLQLPSTEARILLFFARFKTEILQICRKHSYVLAEEKFMQLEAMFVHRRAVQQHHQQVQQGLAQNSNSNVKAVNSASSTSVPPLAPSTSPAKAASLKLSLIETGSSLSVPSPIVTAAASVPPPAPAILSVSRSPNRRPGLGEAHRTFTPRSLQALIRAADAHREEIETTTIVSQQQRQPIPPSPHHPGSTTESTLSPVNTGSSNSNNHNHFSNVKNNNT